LRGLSRAVALAALGGVPAFAALRAQTPDTNGPPGNERAAPATGVAAMRGSGASPGASPWAPPAAVERAIRAGIGARWGLSAEAVEIEWQPARRPLAAGLDVARLLGPGRSGTWIAMLESGTARASLRFRAGVRRRAPVARTDITKDAVLTAEDMGEADVVVWGPPASDDVARVAPGWVARHAIRAGEVLEAPAVEPPAAVTSGSAVTVHWSVGRVTLEVVGEAIGDAAIGDTVLVRLRTGIRVRGVVTDAATVRLIEPAGTRPDTRPRRAAP
jgi:flagella basal body P-ring formation protein FlgA